MSRVFVFVGPTLPLAQARQALPSATFLGPARRGDIARIVLEREPTVIVLIDGLFNTVPAVVHKEILFALTRGVRVFGAASMGALRAAELWTFGMEGVGRIFQRFKEQEWEADDEVAVMHGPAETGFRPASVALANIRLYLDDAYDRNLIGREAANAIVAELAVLFYPERSWGRVFAIARSLGIPEEQVEALQSSVSTEAPDAKRDDALAVLAAVKDLCTSREPIAPPPVAFDFEPSVYWQRLLNEIQPAHGVGAHPQPAGVTYLQLVRDVRMQKDARDLFRGAACLHLLLTRERETMRPVRPRHLQLELDRFRRRRGLNTAEDADEFYREQELADAELLLLARVEAALDNLLHERGGHLAALLGLELKRRGQFQIAKQRVARKQSVLDALGVRSLSLEEVGMSLHELLDWYQDRFETIEGSIASHAEALGYTSVREFLNEVMLEHQIALAGPARACVAGTRGHRD